MPLTVAELLRKRTEDEQNGSYNSLLIHARRCTFLWFGAGDIPGHSDLENRAQHMRDAL